jgi:L-seryl-tRNA(Ser) seleniumtransferase
MTDPRRRLPSVSALLDGPAARPLLDRAPRALVADAVRAAVDAARSDPNLAPTDDAGWSAAITEHLERRQMSSLRPLINATGVVLHTNLGRAPLATAALEAIRVTAAGYSNLEYDLDTGERGSRYTHCVSLIRELTGAEDALVVNNGAAALVLALNTLAEGREAIVSRGELLEIGGSFRIPDIMAKSGAELREVGTTNRTHVDDYRGAVTPSTGVLVKVHRSNFAMEGFVSEVSVRTLAALGDELRLPVVHDLGSGLLQSLADLGLRGETVASDAVADGATLVTMSGDKLLGGPQAGIIIGRSAEIGRLRRNPLTRALRVDKLTLAALEATLSLMRDPGRARLEIPTLAMLAATPSDLERRARVVSAALERGGVRSEVVASEGSVGGGAFPVTPLASYAIALMGNAEENDASLRNGRLPVVGRVVDGRLLLDLRSVPSGDDSALADAVIAALG